MIRPLLPLLLLAGAVPAMAGGAADVAPGAFAFGTLIETTDGVPLHRVRLPVAVYQHSTRADLADLRMFNAGAQPVPYALRTAPAPDQTQPDGVALPVFSLPATLTGGAASPAVHVRIESGGTLVAVDRSLTPEGAGAEAYLVDASALRTEIAALELTFGGAEALVARVDVEASDDLRSFRMVSASAPLLRTRLGGQALSQMRVDLGAVNARYLRIRAAAGTLGAPLERVTALPPTETGVVPREHLVAVNGKASDAGTFVYELDGTYPADRVGIDPAEDNTVLPFEVEGRAAGGQDWIRLGTGTAYRLKQGEVTISGNPIAVRPGPWQSWRIRIVGNAPSGPAPRLRLEWIPAEVVFASRGPGPYMLAYGSGSVKTPGAMPIATLVPGYGTDAAVEIAAATVGSNVKLAGSEALAPATDLRQWGLWGLMAAGALMLGVMASRLLRQGSSRRDSTPGR